MKPSIARRSPGPLVLGLSVLLALGACSEKEKSPHEIQSERMQRSEALLLSFGPSGRLTPLSKAAMNLKTPGVQGRVVFEDVVTFQGLEERWPEQADTYLDGIVQVRDWQVDDEVRQVPVEELDFLSSIYDRVDYFKKAKFKIWIPVPTWHDKETLREWKTTMMFTAKAYLKNGHVAHFEGFMDAIWRHQPETWDEDDPVQQDWRIYDLRMKSMRVTEADDWLFADVLADAVPDPEALEQARRNIHEEEVLAFILGEFEKPYPTWQIASGERHPTVAVVDLDKDGFDDFYVQKREGRNQFFRNNGDGTFDEIAEEIGLAFEGHTSSTAFADFDNDGDLDAFVGGSLERSRLLENVGGKFVDRSGEWIATEDLPYHVSSLNAVDYDGDGLLDIYATTYAAFFAQRAIRSLKGDKSEGKEHAVEDLKQYLTEEEWADLYPRLKNAAGGGMRFLDRPGPMNVLLKNKGNMRFARAEDAKELLVPYNSFQASWSDVDGDGDPDVYIANDFAPNQLMRNDGNGKFTNVAADLGVTDVGFGMGVTWSDIDHDGLQDLYVTNMFSKAARRVTSFFVEGRANFDPELMGDNPLDPIYEQLGAGNSLFCNQGPDTPWKKVSGMERPQLIVEPGGWAWGAIFFDMNNDGYDDIYSPCGYYSAPGDVAVAVDL